MGDGGRSFPLPAGILLSLVGAVSSKGPGAFGGAAKSPKLLYLDNSHDELILFDGSREQDRASELGRAVSFQR